MSRATQTPEVEEVYSDAEALAAALRRITALETQMSRMGAHAAVWAERATGTKGLEHGFHTLAAMAEIGLRDA